MRSDSVPPSPRPVHIAVVGPGEAASEPTLRAAQAIGALVARAGAILVTGGGGGVMQAAAAGCAVGAVGGWAVSYVPESQDRAASLSRTV